ncbi:hypothetical protein ACIO13_24350 [Streptomyces sp. NPDC087425]|uniref:hypothetical protein n=1 Tax=unclassified Streptomyces TaxID=2593676 RepID=UPI003800E24C
MLNLKRAAVVAVGLLALSGSAVGAAQAAESVHQGADIIFPGTTIEDCTAAGDKLQAEGKIVGYACMVNDNGTVSVTPYYND